jgi:hypothetical protein
MSSFGGKVLTGGVLAAIGLVTIKVIMALVSGVMALISFIIFTILPIALIGWLLLKLVGYLKKEDTAAFE